MMPCFALTSRKERTSERLLNSSLLPGHWIYPKRKHAKVLEERSFKELVDRDWQRSYRMGVNAVPTFLIGRQFLVGAVPYETLEKLLIDSSVSKRQQ